MQGSKTGGITTGYPIRAPPGATTGNYQPVVSSSHCKAGWDSDAIGFRHVWDSPVKGYSHNSSDMMSLHGYPAVAISGHPQLFLQQSIPLAGRAPIYKVAPQHTLLPPNVYVTQAPSTRLLYTSQPNPSQTSQPRYTVQQREI
uniref:(California timema) hypothetical protein n=1 Tax=Timema californicum TaxID=61474 RepID=A0A7R9PC95_TIMCA|nr:unnamed protein product [Timema californicum]